MRLSTLRVAWWAVLALREARRSLRRHGFRGARVRPAPAVGSVEARTVQAVLRRSRPTCLERALVLQAWWRAQGEPVEVVLGVTAPRAGFRAHAWLAGEEPCHRDEYLEILRIPPP